LKEGKEVFGISENGYAEKYKIIDGVICDSKYINTSLNYKGLKYYTEEPEPLRFEVNRAYKTRDGKKVYLYQIVKNGDYELYFIGPDGFHFWSFSDGKYTNTVNLCHGNDIVGYWEE